MSRFKQPRSLSKITSVRAAQIVYSRCVSMEIECGNYDNALCKARISELQDYLIQKLRPLLDDILEEAMIIHCAAKGVNSLKDERIMFDLLLHNGTKSLVYKQKPWNIRSETNIQDCGLMFDGDMFCFDFPFWSVQFPKLGKVKVLNVINMECTDRLLEMIGLHCSSLEMLTLCSRGSVSKTGLLSLTVNCNKLRYFVDTDFDVYTVYNYCSIRNFLKSLSTSMEYFNCHYIGKILLEAMEGVDTLSLKKIKECDSSPSQIEAIARYCPKLEDLHLIANARFRSSPLPLCDILTILANSQLQISILDLVRYPFRAGMNEFLVKKGRYLRCLEVMSTTEVTVENISTIAANCPNIKTLTLFMLDSTNRFLVHCFDETSGPDPLVGMPQYSFNALNTLELQGLSYGCVMACLGHAKNITSVTLGNISGLNENTFLQLLAVDTMSRVQVLSLRVSFEILFTKETVSAIQTHCKLLKELILCCLFNEDAILCLKEFRNRIERENLDLCLTFVM